MKAKETKDLNMEGTKKVDGKKTRKKNELLFKIKESKKTAEVVGIRDSFKTQAVIEIPDMVDDYPVTSIGRSAFATPYLCRIIIPNGVTIINEDAFLLCVNLKRVSIPDTVKCIKDGAFCPGTILSGTTEYIKAYADMNNYVFEPK
ncbi:hypothetical protein CLHUN_12980 [Ruminiclostridium hungatei]|uniref:Leucine-rich repeat domain-containing protein n=1 Tax=Ruminiclostridium hungatei TaxID=48256 RepID=A0A1V4SNL4_RUMHU|nr:leucine-rich repeat protein [Ruminiclostridium hungatei]OPX45066.1 hypothetical protein CLHUN_12980 [Ruminiclostridium hungatei]